MSLSNWITRLAFGSAIVALLVVGTLSYRAIAVSSESERWVRHSHEVLENIQQLLLTIMSIESSYRGFVLTGDETYLEPYRASKLSVERHEAAIRKLTADNPEQQHQLPALEKLAAQKIQFAEMIESLRRTKGLEAAGDAIRSGRGEQIMDELQAAVGHFQDEELRLLMQRDADAKRNLDQSRTVLISGTILGLLITAAAGWSVHRDNSRRTLAEAALRDSEEQYRMVLHEVQDYAIYMLNPRGQVVTWNAGAERIKGYSAEEIVNRSFSCFFPPEEVNRGKPEEILRLTAACGRHEEQCMRVRRDGSQFVASVTCTALRDSTGKLRGFSEICRDLSETQELGMKYRGLLEAAPDAMVVVNQRGEIVLLNIRAEKEFGYRRDELIGQRVKNIIPEGFAERLTADGLRSTEDALAQQIGTGIELTGRRKDGSEFPIEIMLSPLEGAEGTLVTAAIRDISVRKTAEKHLAQMEGRYRGLLEAAPDAMVVVNPDGDIVLLNVRAEKEFGYRRDELIGQKVKNIIPEGFAERLTADGLRSTEDVLAQQIGTGIELTGRRKDGSEFLIEIMLSPLENAGGTLVTAAIRDISVRKAKQDKLDQLAHVLDRVPAIVRKFDGEILHWGQGLHALYGWTVEEALGRISHELLATEFPQPLPDILAELLNTEVWQGELVRIHRDGHRVIVASRWELYQRDRGDPVSVLEFDSDITETRKAQAMLKEREARLRSILETAPDAIVTIEVSGIIQSFSSAAEKLFGYAPGEVIGRNVEMLMPAPHREKHDGSWVQYLQTGEKPIIGMSRQVEARRKDGTIFPMDLAVGEVKLGETHIFTGFMRDLTARVKMEQDFRQAQKMEAIGQLTGGVAHDFNNLLTVISGNLEMLECCLTDAEHREILSEAQEASKLGAELTKRLLAFGRRQPLNPKPTDLNALVGGMAEMLRRSLGETVEIEILLAERLPMIMADSGQIENALLNLANNARDAMPNGGRLVIQTAQTEIDSDFAAAFVEVLPGRYVTLTVIDTGTGMTPEVQQRAFEPFYTTKGPGAGSGLGLSMIYGFVKQSGGHVQLYSELGHGTTVSIYLPEHADDASAITERVPTSIAQNVLGETVLVVEDDQRVRRVSVRRLRELGYAVIEADSGAAALLVLDREEPIDVLFTDIVMPGGMTGIDLAHEARRRRSGLRVLFTSGYAEPAAVKGSRLTTNVGWLGKPYSIYELDAKLRDLLSL